MAAHSRARMSGTAKKRSGHEAGPLDLFGTAADRALSDLQ